MRLDDLLGAQRSELVTSHLSSLPNLHIWRFSSLTHLQGPGLATCGTRGHSGPALIGSGAAVATSDWRVSARGLVSS